MISVNGITVFYTGRQVLADVSFVINPRDRIGLVGKNGAGKSTLMKIICRKGKSDGGSVVVPHGRSVGYLSQELSLTPTQTVFEETLTAFEDVKNIQSRIDEVNHQLTTREDYESDEYADLINLVSDLHEKLALLDSGKIESETEKILKGLGFEASDFTRPVSELSGGWQMRIELAKLLLKKHDLLLLDEPTNHLDIESILWLEEFFKTYPGAIMMVSHDKMFLDNVTTRTIEIISGKIFDYKSNYTRYLELRKERLDQQMAAFTNQQKYIAQQERFIERFRAKNTKAKQVQSKIKQLDKLERVEFDETDTRSIHFRFPPAPRSGEVVLDIKNATKSFGDKTILDNINLIVEKGEKIAFVGRNGEGKTTLSKMIAGIENFEGQVKHGHNVALGYYAQLQDKTMDENLTVYQTIELEAKGEWSNSTRIRTLLGAFLFSDDDVDKKVKVLSGGEKSRLALARLLLTPVNLLVLDEPTNHLDISAKEILKNALLNFDGTMIVVSHDREFLQDLTDKTYEFRNKTIKEYYGGINEFLTAKRVASFRDYESEKKQTEAKKEKEISVSKENYELRKEQEKTIKKIKNEIEKKEQLIASLEGKIAGMEKEMLNPDFFSGNNSAEGIKLHEKVKQELAREISRWETLIKDLESEEKKLTQQTL